MSSLDYARFAGGTGFNAEALKPFAESDHGVVFLEKNLHPPGPGIGVLQGMPDHDSQPSLVMEYRIAHTIGAPETATTTWDCLIAVIPESKNPAVYWSYPTGTAAPYTVADLKRIINDTLHISSAEEVQHFTRTRTIAKSCTVYFNAPALSDQGTVYSAQVKSMTQNSPRDNASINAPALVDLGNLPTSGEGVLMLSPKSTMWKAREGAYQSYGFMQPVVAYKSTLAAGTTTAPAVSRYVQRLAWVNGTDSLSVTGTDAYPTNDMTTGFILFTGMALTTTLEVKLYEDLELIAGPVSPFLPLVTPGACLDSKAIDSVYKIRYHMSDGYPSALNFLGSLGAVLAKALPIVGRVATGLSGLLSGNQSSTPVQQQAPQPRPLPAPRPQPAMMPVPAPRAPRPAPRQMPVPAPRTVFYAPEPQRQQQQQGRRRRNRPRRQRRSRRPVEYVTYI